MATVKALVVAGGGGGGHGESNYQTGGGGAGGMLYDASLSVAIQGYTVTVGDGAPGSITDNILTENGEDSSLGILLTATGGGGGGNGYRAGDSKTAGRNGGSGGGHSGTNPASEPGTGIVGQGNDGGDAAANVPSGGGGAGGVGDTGQNASGGVGSSNSISGSAITYSAGGGNGTGAAGTTNRGDGGFGGGNSQDGGDGGSGIVVVSYATDGSDGIDPSSTGGTKTTAGGQTIHTFTSNGTMTFVAAGSPSSSISPSVSPSASSSSSVSPSASSSSSVSPSASISPSASSSSSVSPSASISPSSSSSSSISPSASLSPSSSSSASVSPSASSSSSVSPSPSAGYQGYTRGDEGTLPTNDDDLETIYDAQDIIDVDTLNGVRVDQTATLQYALHQYKDFASENSSCLITWTGQSDYPPSSSTVFLQIYNRNSTTWENVVSNNIANADENFTLSDSIADLTNYKDINNVISCRVYQNAPV